MKAKHLFPLFVGVLSALVPVAGQDQKPTPAPPYLAPVPALGHWTVTLSHPVTSAPGSTSAAPSPLRPGEPSTIDMLEGGGVWLATLTFPGEPSSAVDRRGDSYVQRTADGLRLLGASPSFFVTDGFLFVGWVRDEGAEAFQGVVKYQGVTCFYYKNPKPPADPLNADPHYGTEAWIDAATMLPVAARYENFEADFHFHDSPASPPQLPADEARLVQIREDALKSFNSLR